MGKAFLLVPLLLTVFVLGQAIECPPEDQGLRCYLHNSTFYIPDQNITTPQITAIISNASCYGLSFDDISSGVNASTPTLGARLGGLGISCIANWSVTALGYIDLPGQVLVSFANSSAALNLSMSRNSDGLGYNATLDLCDIDLRVSDLEFRGDLAFLLNLFRAVMIDAIELNANTRACQALRSLVQQNLTELVHKVVDEIGRGNQPDPMPALPPLEQIVDLRNHSFIKVVDYVLNDLVGTTGVVNINRIVDVFTNNSGTLDMEDIPKYMRDNFQLTVPAPVIRVPLPAGGLNLSLDSFRAVGLDTWSKFQLLEPSSNHTLDSDTGVR